MKDRSSIGLMTLTLFLGLSTMTGAGGSENQWQWPERAENLKVLPEDASPERLRNTMAMFLRGLGVRCTHCHEGEEGEPLATYEFPSDVKPNKTRAREMLRMVQSINRSLDAIEFDKGGRIEVDCATCHRGRSRPTTMIQELRAAHAEGGVESAITRYQSLRNRYFARGTLDFSERPLNTFGYQLANRQDFDGAIRVFRMNAQLFPEVANVWDSLAEAYLLSGRHELAAIYYRKSLELDPDNDNALEQLRLIAKE